MGDYSKWEAALAGRGCDIQEDNPLPGFWRVRDRATGRLVGVAIWIKDGHTLALRNRQMVATERVWPWAAKMPCSEEAYRTWDESGVWPDEHALAPSPERTVGNNEPADEAEMLRDQIDSAKAGVVDYEQIKDDEHSARAQSLRSRLLELHRLADSRREAEKKPHWDAAKNVDLKWMGMVKDAKVAADQLQKAMSAFETAKAKAAAQARAKAEREERERQEEARRLEAEAREQGRPMSAPLAAAEPEPAPAPAPARTKVVGAYGRAASIRVVMKAVVKDYAKAVLHFIEEPELRAVVDKLSQRAVDAGYSAPGVEVEETRKVA